MVNSWEMGIWGCNVWKETEGGKYGMEKKDKKKNLIWEKEWKKDKDETKLNKAILQKKEWKGERFRKPGQ